MTSKKKMIISITSICAVLVLAVASIAIVWAAINASVTGGLTVTYVSREIKGDVNAKYWDWTPSGESGSYTETSLTEVAFEGTEGDTAPAKQSGAVEADIYRDSCVVIEWAFTNDNTNATYTAALTTMPTSTDFVITYYTATEAVANPYESEAITESTLPSVTVTNGTTSYVYAKIALNGIPANDVKLEGTFTWTLTAAAAA